MVSNSKLCTLQEINWDLLVPRRQGEASQHRTPKSEDFNTSLQKVQVGTSLTKANISLRDSRSSCDTAWNHFSRWLATSQCVWIPFVWTVWKCVWDTPYSINSWNAANAADSQNYLLWRDVRYWDISQHSNQFKIPNQQVKKQETDLHLGLGHVAMTVTVGVFV